MGDSTKGQSRQMGKTKRKNYIYCEENSSLNPHSIEKER
jgi:hypothetical protein